MFGENEAITTAAKAIFSFAANLGRGDVLKFDDIERISGFERYDREGKWNSLIRKIRQMVLNERDIALRPIITIGYKFCTKDEQLKWCARQRQRRAIRQLNRGVREVGALPANELSVHQQQLKAITVQNLIAERRSVKRGIRSQRNEIKRTETLPRPNHRIAN